MEIYTQKRVTPPYIPLNTLLNFIGKLKSTVVPPVIDASLTQTMSGGMSGALMSCLRFLGLIEQGGKVLPPMKALVTAYETDAWNQVFAGVISDAYSSIVDDLEISSATTQSLQSKFKENTDATGQVLDKAIRFYIAALNNSGQSVSPHITARRPRSIQPRKSGSGTRSARKSIVTGEDDADDDADADELPPTGMRELKLPVPGKQNVRFLIPDDLTVEDWTFLKPIFEAYITRMLAASKAAPVGETP